MSLLVLAAIAAHALAAASAEPETKNAFVSGPTSVPVVVPPNTAVLSRDTGYRRPHGRSPYGAIELVRTGGSVAARLAERRMRVARDAKRETFSVSP